MDYWERRVSRILNGEQKGQPGCIPLEVWDAIGDTDVAQDAAQVAAVGAGVSPEMASDNA